MNHFEETSMLKLIYLIMQKKANLENATGVDTSRLVAKSDLANLKSNIDKLDNDKSRTIPDD